MVKFLTGNNRKNSSRDILYTIQPNPVTNELNILGDLDNIQNFRIFNFNGQLMLNGKRDNCILSLANFVPGLYNLQIIDFNFVIHNLKFLKF